MSYLNILPNETKMLIKNAQRNIPVNLEELAKNMHVTIIHDKEIEGDGLVSYEDNQFYVHINSTHPEKKQRFTLAHELAHIMLHRDYLEEKKSMDKGIRSGHLDTREEQANSLAAEILLPLDAMGNAVNEGNNTLPKLSDFFNVSEEALNIRLNINP